MQKAREEGNFPSARIFVGSLQFLAFVAMLRSWGKDWIGAIHQSMAVLLQHALEPKLDGPFLLAVSLQLGKQVFMPLIIAGAALLGVTVAAQLLVTRLGVSLKKLSPDPKRLNPISRLREIPRQNVPALIQAAIMLPVFGWTAYMLVKDDFVGFLSLPLQSVSAGAARVGGSLQTLLWKASFLFLIFGAVDLLRQKRRYQRDLLMS